MSHVADADFLAAVAAYRAAFFDRSHEELGELLATEWTLNDDVSGEFVRAHFATCPPCAANRCGRSGYSRCGCRCMSADVFQEFGWGRLVFGNTFDDHGRLGDLLSDHATGRRDCCIYLPVPHVFVAQHSQDFFIDPSLIYGLG